ncbi:MAG TPA: hypothetical protein VGN59_14365 [Acidimicrobiia bacterium]|jgi:hypothetical protein
MTRRSLRVLTVGVLAAALLVMGAGFPAEQVPARHWAKSVCTEVGIWVQTARSGASALNGQASTSANLPNVKHALVQYLGATEDATRTVVERLHAAGHPATPQGTQAAAGLTKGFGRIESALKGFEHDARAVPTGRPAVTLARLEALQTKINTKLGALNQAIGNLSRFDPGHKIQKAFRATPACQSLS